MEETLLDLGRRKGKTSVQVFREDAADEDTPVPTRGNGTIQIRARPSAIKCA